MAMIQINLAKKKKKKVEVMGLDFSKFNYPLIVLGLIFYFGHEPFLKSIHEDAMKDVNKKLSKLRKEKKKYQKEEKQLKDIKDRIAELRKNTKRLEERSAQVEKILSIKTNPNKLLERIARSMPEDLWLEKVTINGNRITLDGKAISYKSIGLLIEKVIASPFMDESFREESQDTVEEVIDGTK
ncbi:MAG: PilN domain-containing protein, partial [Bacteriovoracaceae bacterium]